VVDHYVAILKPGGQSCVTTAKSCIIGATSGTGYSVSVVAVSADGVAGPASEVPVTGTAAAPEVPAEVPSTDLTLTTDKGAITSATPGQKITVVGTGFMPFSTATVVIYSDPIVLGTVTTDADGNFSREVEVPTSLAAGQHHLVASGVAPDGSQRFMRMDVTVAAGSASHDGELAWTGFEAAPWVLGGVGAVLVGAVTLLITRRRAAQR
jgi:hypothetical protein